MPSPEQLREQHRRNIFGRAALLQAFRTTFDGPQADMVLRYLCRRYHVFDSILGMEPKSGRIDPNLLLVMEGERRVVLSILRMCKRNDQWLNEQMEIALNENQY